MKVLVEPEVFRHPACGVTRYYAAVCSGLSAAGIEVDLPLVAAGNEFVRPSSPLRWLSRTNFGSRVGARLSREMFRSRLARGDFDVILPTSSHFDSSFLSIAPRKPFLLVCHDTMRSLPVPGGAIDAWADPLHRLLYLARRAARVVCVSGSTRRDLLHASNLDESRISVVPTANLLERTAGAQADDERLPERFLLFVGSRQVRKNFHGTVHALAPLLREDETLRLVCTGPLNVWERDLLAAHAIEGRVVGLTMSDAQLQAAYRRALALVFPTIYEGFGLPVLEAMSAGCPVIASNTSSIPEVSGDAAILIDPFDDAAFLDAARRIVTDEALRARCREAGLARARAFSFERMMNGMVAAFRAAGM